MVVLILHFLCRDHMKTKYESEHWFQERSLPECISAKDALKISLTETLETKLVCSDSPS